MDKPKRGKKKKNCHVAFYFLAVAALTAAAVVVTIKEGNRIKRENELLAYDVW